VGKAENANNRKGSNACIPDLRLKLEPRHRQEVMERVKAGERQEQVAADYGISRQRVSQLIQRGKEWLQN